MAGDAVAELLLVASRLLWYGGCLGAIGASAFRVFVLPATHSDTRPRARSAATVGLAAAALLVTGLLARLYAQAYVSFGLDEPLTAELVWIVATDLPPWSTGWMAQMGAAAFSLGAFVFARGDIRGGWALTSVAALAVAGSAPLTGHAVAQADWYTLPIALQAAHVLAAGTWIGGLLVLVLVGLPAPAPQASASSLQALVGAFSPLALGSAALLGLTGAVTTILYLPALAALWTSRYGLTLLLKVALVGAVAAAGYVNWQHVRPRLTSPGGADALRRSGTAELLLALAVLAITAVLVGLPQPGE